MASTSHRAERRCTEDHEAPKKHPLANGAVLQWFPPCGCVLYDLEGTDYYEGGRVKREPSLRGPGDLVLVTCKVGHHTPRRHIARPSDVLWCIQCGALSNGLGRWVAPKASVVVEA